MSKSTAIFSIAVAEDAVGGADASATTHLPQPPNDNSASWVGMATTTATVDAFAGGEEQFHLQEQGRRTPGEDQPLPTSLKNTTGAAVFGAENNEFIRCLYTEAIEISHRFRGCDGADPTTFGFGTILGSSMGLHTPGQAKIQTKADGAVDGSTVIVADGNTGHDNLAIGAPIRITLPNTMLAEYAVITQISAVGGANNDERTITVHPRFSNQVMDATDIELCFAFFPVVGDSTKTAKRTFFTRFDMGGVGSDASVRRTAMLCRCSGFSLTNDNRGVGLSMTVRPACVLPSDEADASTIATNEPPGDLLQHRYGCEVSLSDPINTATAPIAEPRSALPNFDWSAECSFDVAPAGPDTRGILGMTDMVINNSTLGVTVTSELSEPLQKMIAKRERRTLICGMGPAGDGEGGALIVSNCGRADGSANPGGGENNLINQTTALNALAEFDGCATTDGDGNALTVAQLRLSTAPFMLALPRK